MNLTGAFSRPPSAPAAVSLAVLQHSIVVEPLTCAIGAELRNVSIGAASRDPALIAEIRAQLLKYKVLFFRDQDITRAKHFHSGRSENPAIYKFAQGLDDPDRYPRLDDLRDRRNALQTRHARRG